MTIEILMPALSPTMTEGNLVKWHKQEGSPIESGDLLAEIETDKATMEVEAVDEGVLGKILIDEGSQNVAVNSVIALILEEGEDISVLDGYRPESRQGQQDKDGQEVVMAETPNALAPSGLEREDNDNSKNNRVKASPLAKRIAAQNRLELASIEGTGPRGRIVKADVEAAIEKKASKKEFSALGTLEGGFRDVPISQMRKVIAARLSESKQRAPHFYVTIDCLMDDLLSIRKHLNVGLGDDRKVSVNDFIVKACALALKDVPDANVSWLGDMVRYYDNADISIAVSVDGGLITPILKNAESKPLLQISDETKILIKKAREGILAPEEFQGGSFSISNMGMYGVKQFNAVINPPQGCIIAIGSAEQRPVVIDGEIRISTQMTATLSVDHRAVDGAVAAQFMKAFKKYIENPLLIVV